MYFLSWVGLYTAAEIVSWEISVILVGKLTWTFATSEPEACYRQVLEAAISLNTLNHLSTSDLGLGLIGHVTAVDTALEVGLSVNPVAYMFSCTMNVNARHETQFMEMLHEITMLDWSVILSVGYRNGGQMFMHKWTAGCQL